MDFRGLALFSISVCFHMGLTLRCACREYSNYCTSFHNMSVDFKTAEETCIAMGGTLPMRWNDALLPNEKGHFWIGTNHNCSKTNDRGDTPRSVNQARKETTCSLQCMSVSSNRTQTERPCKERLNGFQCEGIPWESCWMEKTPEVIMLSEKSCALAPCEHLCKVAPGGVGYVCSCHLGFKLSSRGPRYCSYECSSSPCKGNCRKLSDTGECATSYDCPDGFIEDNKKCADVDECSSNPNCAQECINTLGSYKCSCSQDFMLVNRSECVPRFRSEGDPSIPDVLRPSMNYTTRHAGFSSPGEYIGLTVFIVLAVAALIVLLLYYLRKRKPNADVNTYDDLNDARSQERI